MIPMFFPLRCQPVNQSTVDGRGEGEVNDLTKHTHAYTPVAECGEVRWVCQRGAIGQRMAQHAQRNKKKKHVAITVLLSSTSFAILV